ncbi:MAG: LEA type 2 family protein [Acidobacteriota bacterium]
MTFAQTHQSTEAKPPQVELQTIRYDKFDFWKKTIDVIAVVSVKNQTAALKLQDVTYKLKLNDNAVAEGKHDKDIEIPATGEVEIELPFTVDLTSIPGVAWDAMTESFTLRYEIETEFTVPLFASLKHTQKSSFKGDLPIGEAVYSLSKKFKERLFGKP